MQTICSYEWDDVDAGVLCRHLGMGMSGRATHLPRDSSFVGANAYGVYCHGNETDAYDCYVSENDTTNGMCATIYDDAGVECEGKILLLFLGQYTPYALARTNDQSRGRCVALPDIPIPRYRHKTPASTSSHSYEQIVSMVPFLM
jgi:hypothetical protein